MAMRYRVIAWSVWLAGWFPVSMLFGSNPHFPSAFLSPFLGIVAVGERGAWDPASHLFSEVTLPFLVFWSVTIAATCWVLHGFLRQATRGAQGVAP